MTSAPCRSPIFKNDPTYFIGFAPLGNFVINSENRLTYIVLQIELYNQDTLILSLLQNKSAVRRVYLRQRSALRHSLLSPWNLKIHPRLSVKDSPTSTDKIPYKILRDGSATHKYLNLVIIIQQ